jgi:Na+/melibiose symporter-like transporter
MSRSDEEATAARSVERVAHAFTPSEWSGRSFAVVSVVFVVVAATTVVQRALVADGAVGWTITAIHAVIVAIVVPLLIGRAVRERRAAQASMDVPE